MKISEMNQKQKLAFEKAIEATNFVIGGYENAVQDGELRQDEIPCQADLITEIYDSLDFSQKEMKFAGKDFIIERIRKRLIKYGYTE